MISSVISFRWLIAVINIIPSSYVRYVCKFIYLEEMVSSKTTKRVDALPLHRFPHQHFKCCERISHMQGSSPARTYGNDDPVLFSQQECHFHEQASCKTIVHNKKTKYRDLRRGKHWLHQSGQPEESQCCVEHMLMHLLSGEVHQKHKEDERGLTQVALASVAAACPPCSLGHYLTTRCTVTTRAKDDP